MCHEYVLCAYGEYVCEFCVYMRKYVCFVYMVSVHVYNKYECERVICGQCVFLYMRCEGLYVCVYVCVSMYKLYVYVWYMQEKNIGDLIMGLSLNYRNPPFGIGYLANKFSKSA